MRVEECVTDTVTGPHSNTERVEEEERSADPDDRLARSLRGHIPPLPGQPT